MRSYSSARRLFRPAVEALENRALLSICMVDRLNDLGEGSGLTGDLRYCLTRAQDGDAVVFGLEGTVNLTRALPVLTRSVIIVGPGADVLTVRRDSNDPFRIFTVGPSADVIILGIAVNNGESDQGGGIFNEGSLTLLSTAFFGNRGQGTLSGGGGVFNQGYLAVFDSTFSGNSTDGLASAGGAIANIGGVLYISNSTVSGNVSRGERGLGAGIATGFGVLVIEHCTIANNAGTEGGGVFQSELGGLTVLRSSIIANNTARIGPDIWGEIDSAGHNLVGNSDDALGFEKTDLLDVDPLLGPLADNGGPTLTHALMPGSPAIDAGDPTGAPEWDQRGEGFRRLVGQGIDIGAFEIQAGSDSPPRFDPAVFLAQERSRERQRPDEDGSRPTAAPGYDAHLALRSLKNVTSIDPPEWSCTEVAGQAGDYVTEEYLE